MNSQSASDFLILKFLPAPKSGKQSGGLWEELGLLPVTGTEQVPSLPVTDKVVLCVLCSWTLISLGAHRYSAIACLSMSSTRFWRSTLPQIRCYRGTCIPTLNAFGMREGLHSQTVSFSPANGLYWPAALGFATAFLFPSPITLLSCRLAQWSSHPGLLLSHAGL